MSWKIEIHRAKPNPLGKDKPRYGAPDQAQLLGEWVDLKNVGDKAVALTILNLAHIEYDSYGRPKAQPSIYWTGSGSGALAPGATLRVHTGKSSYSSQMKSEDQTGVNMHAFAEKGNFVLNNKEGDTISVWWKASDTWHKEDEASYDPSPPEGAVLVRQGQKLVHVRALAGLRY